MNNFRFNSKNLSLKSILLYVIAAAPRRGDFWLSFVLILILGLLILVLTLVLALVFGLLSLIVALILGLLIVLHFNALRKEFS